jgi:GT2 family glycosyltransferase
MMPKYTRDATPRGEEVESQARVREWLHSFPTDAPVVVVPVFNAYEDTLECIESLLAASPPGTPILMLDDASTDARIASALTALSADGRFLYVRKSTNTGFVGTVNLAFAWCAPRDVVVVNSDVIVPPAWLERLQTAAYYRSTIATATPFTNHGTILSVPYRNQPVNELPGGMTVKEVDDRIRQTSLRLYPVIPTAVGHCMYFKRSALNAVGYFDAAFAPGYGEEVDFSQRAVVVGFLHVLADDLFVYHKGSRSFEGHGQELKRRIRTTHDKLVFERYPWYAGWITRASADTQSALARAIERAQVALLGCRIAIDATCVAQSLTGTQIGALELIRALAKTPGHGTRLSIIVQDGVDKATLLGVDQLVDEVVAISELQGLAQPRFNLVHRPFQVRTVKDLIFLKGIAHRVIISQLDFIAFSNPSYAAHPDDWKQYRRLTWLALGISDGIIFNSHDVAKDARQQGMYVESERSCVASPGVDHLPHSGTKGTAVGDSSKLPEPPFILMLGTNFRHKNRLYALALMRALTRKHDWDGKLVFAGPNATWGGSEADEALLLERSPELQTGVCYLGSVSETEKQWLLENATLVLYPSTYEGFGLVPFEAAAAGTPALTTRAASLGEVLGDSVTYLDTFDPEDGADVVWSLISDPVAAARQLAAIQARMAILTWSAAAKQTWNFYMRILALPPRLCGGLVGQPLDRELREMFSEGSESLPGWRKRMARAFYIGFTEGLRPLFHEICQYIRWIL